MTIIKVMKCKNIFHLQQNGCKKKITWLQRSAPHKQDDHGVLLIPREKSKYGSIDNKKLFVVYPMNGF